MFSIPQRRIAALLLIILAVGISLSVNGWQYSPLKWLLDIDKVTNGSFTAGDPYTEWAYGYCDGEQQQVVVLRDGQLVGAEGLKDFKGTELQRCDLPLVDHPELANWKDQLDRIQNITQKPNVAVVDVLDAAFAMSLSSLYLKPLESWLTAKPEHAIDFLDLASAIEPDFSDGYMNYETARRENFSAMTSVALAQVTKDDLNPERMGRWLNAESLANQFDALITLALMTDIDVASKARLLEKLNNVEDDQQLRVYRKLATSLVAEPRYAKLLVQQLKNLPRKERLGATEYLLAQNATSDEVISELLNDFDDVFYGQTVELNAFITIANKTKERPEFPRQLAMTLKDLRDTERRQAAIHLVSLDDINKADFTLNVLYQFDELHSLSRPKVMDEILVSPQFQREDIQKAALNSIQNEMDGSERREYLNKMLASMNINESVESRIRIALND